MVLVLVVGLVALVAVAQTPPPFTGVAAVTILKQNAFKIEGVRTQAGKYVFQPLLVDMTRPDFEPLFNRALYGRPVSRSGTAQRGNLTKLIISYSLANNWWAHPSARAAEIANLSRLTSTGSRLE